MRRVIGVAGVAVVGCAGEPETCGNAAVASDEVCLIAAPDVDERADALIDFDGDGIEDLVAREHDGPTRLLHNRGDATFEVVAEVELGSRPLVLRDLDDDGIDELGVVADGDPTELRDLEVHAWDGEGVVLAYTLEGVVPPDYIGHVVGDFDGQGRRDVVFVGGTAVLLRGMEEGFAEPLAFEDATIAPHGVAEYFAVDLDGDGVDELGHVWTDGLRLRRGPELETAETLAWPEADPSHAEAGDVDGDGVDEVLVQWGGFGIEPLRGAVLRASADTWTTLYAFEAAAAHPILADVNADGLDDLVIAGTQPREDDPGQIRLALGDGTFAAPVRIPALDFRGWEPGHLDDDGVLDLTGFCFSHTPATPVRCRALLSHP